MDEVMDCVYRVGHLKNCRLVFDKIFRVDLYARVMLKYAII